MPPYPDSNAYRTLLDGNFQDWQLGIQSQWNIGFRREMAGVRNAQMALAKEQTLLQEGELEFSHQLAYAIRDLETNFVLIQTAFSRGVAAKRQLDADQEIWNEGVGGIAILDTLFRAQQEFSDAQSNYYRTLVDYNRSISQVHYRKGSLLEYNGVYLAEGPWPGKAYFDARRRARARDAATYLDYGFTQPRVMSRGPIEQHADAGMPVEGGPADATPAPAQAEAVPTPEPQPAAGPAPTAPAEKEPPKPAPATPAPAETLPAEPALRPGPQASAAGRTAPPFVVPASAGGRLKAELQTAADWRPARNADSQSAAQTPANRQVRPAGWTVVEKGSSYESGENPPPAPGWTGVQR